MINYIYGNLFELLPYESYIPKFICHIVNNEYKMGSGFVVPLNQKWPQTKTEYLEMPILQLGHTQFIKTEDNIWVCNMIAQNGVVGDNNKKPIKYSALISCMQKVKTVCAFRKGEIHCPAFGSGLAQGNWELIQELIEEIWGDISVFVYRLK